MAKSLEKCLIEDVLSKYRSKENDEVVDAYVSHAVAIRDYIIDNMKEVSKDFAEVFDGLVSTGSFLDDLKVMNLPSYFATHIKLKFDFNIEPQKHPQTPGFIELKVGKNVTHAAVRDDRDLSKNLMARTKLQNWIRDLIYRVLGNGKNVRISGDCIYTVQYARYARGNGAGHVISAVGAGKPATEIYFELVPVIEFPAEKWPLEAQQWENAKHKVWFAVPIGSRIRKDCRRSTYTFMPCAPHLARIAPKGLANLLNSLRLVKVLRDTNEMLRLTPYMLKSVYLMQMGKSPAEYWNSSVAVLVINVLAQLLESLEKQKVPYFMDFGFRHEISINSYELMKFKAVLKKAMTKLRELEGTSLVKASEVVDLFFTALK